MRPTLFVPAPLRSLGLILLCAGPLVAQQPSAPAPRPATPSSGVRLSGYLQARETWQKDIGLTGSINRARLTAAGGIATNFTWRIQGEFRTGNVGNGKASVSLQDAYIRWKHEDLGLQAGQFKTPFTREFVTSLPDLETADRATVVDSLAPKRDIGVMVDYDLHPRLQVFAGVFNGEGANTTANRDSTVLGVARAAVRLHRDVTIGANVARYFGDSTRFGADANFEGSRVTIRAEVVAQARDSLGGDRDRGWLLLGAYKVTERLQLVGKFEDFQRPEVGGGQDNRAWTGAVNLLLAGSSVRLTCAYIRRRIGDPGAITETLLGQLQVRF